MSDITKPWKLAKKSLKIKREPPSSRQSHPFLAEDPGAVVGQFHTLPVQNLSDYGVYLRFGRDRVLLPNKYVPTDISLGEKIRVFIYTDSEDRPVATTLTPAGVVGDIVALSVKDTASFGVFMDWGLDKDLLVPRSEQQGRMEKGETHLVKICLDKSTHRIYGSTLMAELCPGEPQTLSFAMAVDLIIHSITPIGYTALINRSCAGLLYENETFERLTIGDRRRGYVLQVREDGKVDLTLKQPGYASVEGSALKILEILEAKGGFSPCHDKTSPQEIQAEFSMSKKEFKRALGSLYRQGRITLHKSDGIRLNTGQHGTTRPMTLSGPISLHGGHAGEFCCHAKDPLADIIEQYIQLGFRQVGITEHIPPLHPKFLYPEEIEQGLTVDLFSERFARYFTAVRQLKADLADRIRIFAGMETEACTGYLAHVRRLVAEFSPDYLVGSVHHVADICFDYSLQTYQAAVRACGSVEDLYLAYFDRQFEMIKAVRPFVVGHFDLVRIHDPDYAARVRQPQIAAKIDRNLDLIRDLNLVMDLNLRPLARGEAEPYPTRSILEKIRSRQIPMVPGDDSHGVAQAGKHVDAGIRLLEKMGFDTRWPVPRLLEMPLAAS